MKSHLDKERGVCVFTCGACGYKYYDTGNNGRNRDINRSDKAFITTSNITVTQHNGGSELKSVYICPKCGVLQVEIEGS